MFIQSPLKANPSILLRHTETTSLSETKTYQTVSSILAHIPLVVTIVVSAALALIRSLWSLLEIIN